MKLAVSNIGFTKEDEPEIYEFLNKLNYTGLEIAPTRIFENNPYEHKSEFKNFCENLKQQYNLQVCSMQSIWYGVTQSIFGTKSDINFLIEYTKKAIDFASEGKCKNLVFGCPKNRNMPVGANISDAEDFFWQISEYAYSKGCFIALEANPEIYGTNFINTTKQAFNFRNTINSKGLSVNVDLGTIINNNESLNEIVKNIENVSHIHISEPYLKPIENRQIHSELKILQYNGYISIEMGKTDDIECFKKCSYYISNLFAK